MKKLILPIIVVFLVVLLCGCATNNGKTIFSLNDAQKKEISNYANQYLTQQSTDSAEKLKDINIDYYKLFLTFYLDGNQICTNYGMATEDISRVENDIAGVIDSCREHIDVDEISNIDMVFDFLSNPQSLGAYDLDGLTQNIELGINGLRLQNSETGVDMASAEPITQNLDHEKILNKLCEQIGLDKDCYQTSEVEKFKFDSLVFLSSSSGDVTSLYRYNKIITLKNVSSESVQKSIELGYDWMENDVNAKTNLLEYLYFPSINSYSDDDNDVRRMAATWAVTEVGNFTSNDSMDATATATLEKYLADKKTNNYGSYIKIDDDAKIAYNAFIIMLLINTPDYPNRDTLLKELGSAILGNQQDNGSYVTDFVNSGESGKDYYPGEAMLALMKLYKETGDGKYLESVEKAFPYYRDYWRENKNTAFIPWHSQAYLLYYKANQNNEMKDFVFEMNDWLIDNYQLAQSDYPDYIGGFKARPSNSTASYLEGIADAYELAKISGDDNHMSKYQKASALAARFVMQTQYTTDNTFYLEDTTKVLGGFRQSLTNNQQRNDYTQHATLSLIKMIDYKIVE